jgi:hypothetical protein
MVEGMPTEEFILANADPIWLNDGDDEKLGGADRRLRRHNPPRPR